MESNQDDNMPISDQLCYWTDIARLNNFKVTDKVCLVGVSDLFPSGQMENPPRGFKVEENYYMLGSTVGVDTQAIDVLRDYTVDKIELINMSPKRNEGYESNLSLSSDISFKGSKTKKRTKIIQKIKSKFRSSGSNPRDMAISSDDSIDEIYIKKVNNLQKRNENLIHISENMESTIQNMSLSLDNKNDEIKSLRSELFLSKSQLENYEDTKEKQIREIHNKHITEYNMLKDKVETTQKLQKKLLNTEIEFKNMSDRITSMEKAEAKLVIKNKEIESLNIELNMLMKQIASLKEKQDSKGKEKDSYSPDISSGSDTDDSYFCSGQNKANFVELPGIVQEPRLKPNKLENKESTMMKDMLQLFKSEIQNERKMTLENHKEGMSTIAKNMNNIISKSDLQRIISSISMTLNATDIRVANGAGLLKINKWIRQVEKASEEEEARRSMLWLKADNSVIQLLGLTEKTSLTWEEIKEKLRSSITESDPIEALLALRRHHWLGHEDPLAYATTLRETYDLLNPSNKSSRTWNEVLTYSLTTKMNYANRSLWKQMFRVNHEDTIIKLCKRWNNRGRSYLFDDIFQDISQTIDKPVNTLYDQVNHNLTLPTKNVPFSTMGAHGDSRQQDDYSRSQSTPYSTTTGEHQYQKNYKSQDVRFNENSSHPQRRKSFNQSPGYNGRYSPRGREGKTQTQLARIERVKHWLDWLCAKCGEHNQKYYYRCIKCNGEAQKHQLPPESWQCRQSSCTLQRNYWNHDRWCFGCPFPSPLHPELTRQDYPFHSEFINKRQPSGTFTKTTEVIQPN